MAMLVLPYQTLLRLSEVLRRFSVSRTSWYDGMNIGMYPPPVRLGKRTVAWREADIEALIRGLASILAGIQQAIVNVGFKTVCSNS